MTTTNRAWCVAVLFAALTAGRAPAQDPVEKLLDEFTNTNDAAGKVFVREGAKLAVTPPNSILEKLFGRRSSRVFFKTSAFAVEGDFEFAANFDVRQLGPKEPGDTSGEANAELSIEGGGHHGIIAINVNSHPETPSCFRVMRTNPNRGGTHYNMLTFPRKSSTGRIGLRRQGSEILLLASDGPGEPMVELVRYPCNPILSPKLRISTYQGAVADVVNVEFSNFAIKADRILRGAEAMRVLPPAVPAAKYGVHLDYSKNPALILKDFNRTNDQSNVFRVEGNALRISPPPQSAYRKDISAYWFRDSRFAIEGDFEISFRYQIHTMGPIGTEGYGSTTVGMGLETESQLGSLSFGRGIARNYGDRFGVTRHSPSRLGSKYDTQVIRTSGKSGWLVLQRVGAEVIFLAQENDNPNRSEVTRLPFTPGLIKRFRLVADRAETARTP